ncbi:MAG TPA: ankyrin repeat domain-containing protein [Thiobacillus sp.]
MTRAKKTALWLVAIAGLLVAGSWSYVIAKTLTNFETLLICSQGLDNMTPKALCQAYLFKFGGKQDEIAALNQGTGLGWVIDAKDDEDRQELVAFLLDKGVNINAIDRRSGLTILHGVVLENNLKAVELLLRNGANPRVKDRDNRKTPLEFARALAGKPNQPDRTAIISLLESAEGEAQ